MKAEGIVSNQRRTMMRDSSGVMMLDHNFKSKGQKEQQMLYPMRNGIGQSNMQITSPKIMRYIKMSGIMGRDQKNVEEQDNEQESFAQDKRFASMSGNTSQTSLKQKTHDTVESQSREIRN